MHSKDLQIDWLRAFVAIVDAGSITAAARQISRSQSAVSMQLKKLEDSIGRPLLVRGPRQLSLTPTGYDLLAHARRLLDFHAATLTALHGGQLTGRITFGVADDYAMRYGMAVLRDFVAKYVEVEITIVCEQSTSLLAKVDRGEVDLAVVTRDRPHRGELLFREPLVWVASQEHKVWLRNPIPIAVHELDGRLRAKILAAFSSLQREYKVVYNSPNVGGQLMVATAGTAVSVITRCNLVPHLMIVGEDYGLPSLADVEVVAVRSEETKQSKVVDAMYSHVLTNLQRPE